MALEDLAVSDAIEFGGGEAEHLGAAIRELMFENNNLRLTWIKVARQCIEETLVGDDESYLVKQFLQIMGIYYFITRAQQAY